MTSDSKSTVNVKYVNMIELNVAVEVRLFLIKQGFHVSSR